MVRLTDRATLDLSSLIRAGDHILWGEGAGEPRLLIDTLLAQAERIGAVTIFAGYSSGRLLSEEAPACLSFRSYGALGSLRGLASANRLEIVPDHIGMLPHLIDSGHLRCDVAMVHVSPSGPDGRHSLGASVMHMESAIRRARVVIAEINDQIPYTFGSTGLGPDDIDVAIMSSEPLPEDGSAEPGRIERAIAHHASDYVSDGATLQVGIGAVPHAVLEALKAHRDLGIHSGMIGDSLGRLIEAGVVTNARKPIDTGVSITGILVGTRFIYDLAATNPALEVRPSSYVHDPAVLARLDNLVSINSALEVDLSGQVNAEAVGTKFVGAVGGQADFMRGAHRAANGCSIIALSSTTGRDRRSRIRHALSGPVSTPRADVDVVVTEHGAADLRGLSLRERRRALIAIADPTHREQLEAAGED